MLLYQILVKSGCDDLFESSVHPFRSLASAVLFELIALTVFKKLLLTLKPYLLGECDGIAVLHTLLCVAWVQPDVRICLI